MKQTQKRTKVSFGIDEYLNQNQKLQNIGQYFFTDGVCSIICLLISIYQSICPKVFFFSFVAIKLIMTSVEKMEVCSFFILP